MEKAAVLLSSLFLISSCTSGDGKLDVNDIRLQRFLSCDEIDEARTYRANPNAADDFLVAESGSEGAAVADSNSFSGETNVQVEGVDEIDRTKATGNFIYHLEGPELLVLKRLPASGAAVVQRIPLNRFGSGLFVRESDVVVIGGGSLCYAVSEDLGSGDVWYPDCGESGVTLTRFIRATDGTLSGKETHTIENTGFTAARAIGSRIHLITNSYMDVIYPEQPEVEVHSVEDSLPVARTKTTQGRVVECTDVYHEPASETGDAYYYPNHNLTCVFSVDIDRFSEMPDGECALTDYVGSVYASAENLFLSSGGWDSQTAIHQFALEDDDRPTEYVGSALVDGYLLNQFSMDEHEGHLRVASHTNESSDAVVMNAPNNLTQLQVSDSNRVDVFKLTEGDPRQVGEIEGIAPGEQIYSVRFMGDRGFVVTFKKVDPLFALDLSDPQNPQIKGELKIPGYSSYLHPMSDGYLLAVGKDAEAAQESDDFAWYQGMAMSIFDVRDLSDPKLVQKIGIGSRGTDSEALYDHKAFRYIAEKDLVVIPISLYEGGDDVSDFGEHVFSGFHIYRATIDDGFSLVGESEFENEESSWWGWSAEGRSFYAGGVISLIGGGEFVLRSADDPDSDLRRISLE